MITKGIPGITVLKSVASVLLCGIVVFSLISCKGDTGPAGPNGNANVHMYTFGSQTTTNGALDYQIADLAQSVVDSSLILAYYNPSNEAATAWYQIPGLGSTGAYMTRYFIYQTSTTPSTYTFSVRLETPSGSGGYTSSVTFTKLKLIFAQASVVTALSKTGQINTADYYSVAKALQIQE